MPVSKFCILRSAFCNPSSSRSDARRYSVLSPHHGSNAGQGAFYRSQHELIGVFRVGEEPHLNNVELGRHGRSRSNVWHYAGVNTFRAGRLDDLQSHPTVKPVALVADAMKDCTRRGDIVLDTFCGSGTTILAAERVGRRAYTLELEPRFVDVSVKRWQAFSRCARSGCRCSGWMLCSPNCLSLVDCPSTCGRLRIKCSSMVFRTWTGLE